ncbi:hypothetical protein [Sphingomonas nostoxanthinifaciens]|uniref:hypothetical protein n=1 Tax=Sphingomonas nostoxanthinifaciens TaxID=2872652 RepID=UPI001CC200F7|nr:hypothetical protein [Sphingomonas nostoxanthinifaciens]UAK24281.1 hypothetical protein K8P63_18480 [Sphingomonas nostoxanthinifaciens]
MSIRVEGDVIRLEGRCRLEEAEPLLGALLASARPEVDLTDCTAIHTAVVQILLACRPSVRGRPDHPFLVRYVLPLLTGAASPSAPGVPAL